VRRHPAAIVLALWGVANVALSTLLFAFTTDLMSHVVYWVANVAVFTVVALAVVARDPAQRVLPEASGGVVALAVGIAFLALGAGIGSWAVLVGAAVLAVAVVLLATERRA
jgi:hypothetical protein